MVKKSASQTMTFDLEDFRRRARRMRDHINRSEATLSKLLFPNARYLPSLLRMDEPDEARTFPPFHLLVKADWKLVQLEQKHGLTK